MSIPPRSSLSHAKRADTTGASSGSLFLGRLDAGGGSPGGTPAPTSEPWSDGTYWSDGTGWIPVSDQPGTPTDTYYSRVIGMSGLVAYWRLGDVAAGKLADHLEQHDGTYPATPQAFATRNLTWNDSDGRCVEFGSIGYGEVPHDSAFALAEGALSFVMQPGVSAIAGGHGFLSKDASGSDLLSLRLQSVGLGTTADLVMTFGGATVTTARSYVNNADERGYIRSDYHHVIVTWNTERVILYVDGHRVGWSEAHTSGLVNNTAPWHFGRTAAQGNGNVAMDEVALLNRMLTPDEVGLLYEFERQLVSYDTSAGNVIQANAVDFVSVINGAGPGDVIELAGGSYPSATFSGVAGTRTQPIVVKPADNGNRPQLNGSRWTVENSSWVILDGMNGSDAELRWDGVDYCRITRCSFTNIFSTCIDVVTNGATNCRIDHCEFTDHQGDGAKLLRCIRIDGTAVYEARVRTILIDHCRFYDLTPPQGINGNEVIAAGSNGKGLGGWARICIETNLFENINIPVEGEIITCKSSGGIMRFNTFDDLGDWMYVNARQAIDWEWRSNWLSRTRTAGLRVYWRGHLVIGNHHDTDEIALPRGNLYAQDALDALPTTTGDYGPSEECLAVANTATAITVGVHNPSGSPDLACRNNFLEAHTSTITVDGTYGGNPSIIATTSEPYTPAAKLTAASVGRFGVLHDRTPTGHW